MDVKRIYYEDLQIAGALIRRDEIVTRRYFYRWCYPLFKSIYDNYYTDCMGCKEFIDEIYLLVLSPNKVTGKCQMENFKGESTLASWLKTACLYYCYRKYERKNRMPVYESLIFGNNQEKEDHSDREEEKFSSIEIDFNNLNREDALAILKRCPTDVTAKLYASAIWNFSRTRKLQKPLA